MLVVGVTGGIGSGKSAVSQRFEDRGVTVVDADVVAREVVEPGTAALQAIAEHFGPDVLTASGALDRAALRQVVFADDAERKWLEQLLHPLIGEEIVRQLNGARSEYAMLVSPLLIETAQRELCDRILVVDVPEAVQVERTMARDGNTREQVERIIASQADRQRRLDSADDVIANDGPLEELDRKVAELHKMYLDIAARQHD